VAVEPDAIYVQDDDVWTSAGVTAGIDLALALVADDHGHRAAVEVARQLVVYLR
jgi:transcriptional regulator GlxA family with amidase domain